MCINWIVGFVLTSVKKEAKTIFLSQEKSSLGLLKGSVIVKESLNHKNLEWLGTEGIFKSSSPNPLLQAVTPPSRSDCLKSHPAWP